MFFFNHKKQDVEAVMLQQNRFLLPVRQRLVQQPLVQRLLKIVLRLLRKNSRHKKSKRMLDHKKIDEQAILNGDFSTLVGTWRNGLGQEFTFDKNGLVNSGNIEKVSMGNHGTIEFSVRSGFTGYGMSVYPAGLIIDGLDSDLSKNRLTAGQAAPTSSEQVFYKVD